MASTSSYSPKESPEHEDCIGNNGRNDQYYIPDGDVVFLVENTLFRVHRYFLSRESPVFRDMLSLPTPTGKEAEGASDENPIHLPQLSSVEFSYFLWVFYHPKYSEFKAPVETWKHILRVAHLFQCDNIRNFAFKELDKLYVPAVERVVLTMKFDAETEWKEKALAELGARWGPLTVDEAIQLGLETTVRVAALRERILARRQSGRWEAWQPSFPYPEHHAPTPVLGPFDNPIPMPVPMALPRTPSPVPTPLPLPPRPDRAAHTQQNLDDVRDIFGLGGAIKNPRKKKWFLKFRFRR